MKKIYLSTMLFLIALHSSLGASSLWAAEQTPKELEGVGINPRLGEKISLENSFQDESDKTVKLSQYFDGKRPVVLVLNYYGCPMLCGLVLNALRDAVQEMNWLPGEKYQIVTVSIDPREDYTLAAAKKDSILKSFHKKEMVPGAEANWHFLVGKKENSERLASEIGFKYKYIPADKQYAHGAAFFLFSPTGKLTRALPGIGVSGRDLKLALLEASEGKVGTFAEKLLLFCYHYDPKGNQYAMRATNVMKLGGAVFVVVVLFAYAFVFFRQRKKG